MHDYFLSDAEVGKPPTGWSSSQLWKTTIEQPKALMGDRDPRSLGQILDEEEDRQLVRRRKLARISIAATWWLMSIIGLVLFFALGQRY